MLTPHESKVGRGGRYLTRANEVYRRELNGRTARAKTVAELWKFAVEHDLPRSTVPYLFDAKKRSKVPRKKPEQIQTGRLDESWTVRVA